MKPILFYCYDAYCGWCFGFSPVMQRFNKQYQSKFDFEVLSGGMIIRETPLPIAATAGYIQKAYKNVETLSGVKFGTDYLWHIENPEKSDWFPDSEKPAIALCVFKELFPHLQVNFAADLQYALHFEGRDLCDNASYLHLLKKYAIDPDIFYQNLASPEYKEKAYYEFALCKQLQVTGYPALLLQTGTTKFYAVANGYTDWNTLEQRIENILKEIKV